MKTHHFSYFKSILLSCLLFLINNNLIFGQTVNDYKHEFKLGYGVLSLPEIGLSFGNAIGVSIGSTLGLAVGDYVSIIVNGQRTNVTITRIENKSHLYGTFQVGYNRFVKKRLSLGLQGSYTPIRFKDVVYYSNGSSRTYTSRADYAQMFGRMDFHYILKPRFQMYFLICFL